MLSKSIFLTPSLPLTYKNVANVAVVARIYVPLLAIFFFFLKNRADTSFLPIIALISELNKQYSVEHFYAAKLLPILATARSSNKCLNRNLHSFRVVFMLRTLPNVVCRYFVSSVKVAPIRSIVFNHLILYAYVYYNTIGFRE